MNPPESPDRSYWKRWRLFLWAVALSVLSVFVQLKYFIIKEGGGPILSAVIGGSIFRVLFLFLVIYRLRRTPEPQAGTSAFEMGHGFRGTIVQSIAGFAMLYHVLFFWEFLLVAVWLGTLTSILWIAWIYGMAVRENARCWQLEE